MHLVSSAFYKSMKQACPQCLSPFESTEKQKYLLSSLLQCLVLLFVFLNLHLVVGFSLCSLFDCVVSVCSAFVF